MDERRNDGRRWAARPALARCLRATVFLSPVAASVGASWLVHLGLGPAGGRLAQAWHLGVLVIVSTLTLLTVDRAVRRALPLVTLLELTMLFPDRAPSRLRVARDAIRARPIEEQLARVREAGADPVAAAREILALVAALRVHDRPTRGHAERVRMYTDLIAEAMGVPARDRDLLRWAAILHDIGKLRVPPSILNKPGKPTADEWAVLRAHPAHGAEMAGALLPWLGEWGEVIVQHHERYDGSGYPGGLAGREISFGGRLVAVADAYDVMTAARAYQRPISRAAANAELVKWSGRQFDPLVVRAMVGLSAPRLRRAQGIVAWLSDIPIVASGAVPASTVARVVGAGALVTGAAAGLSPVTPLDATPLPERATDVAVGTGSARSPRSPALIPVARPQPRSPDRNPSGSAASSPSPSRSARPTAAPALPTAPAASDGRVLASGGRRPAEPRRAATTSSRDPVEPAGSSPAPPTSRPSPPPAGGGPALPERVESPVGSTVDTVTTTADATVGTVTDVAASAVPVASPVAAAVAGTTGIVTSTVGGLLGTKK